MRPLRRLLDKVGPHFEKGGRLESYQALYEMLDTLFYSPPDVSRHAPHVRDAIDLKRVMGLVVIGVLPCAVVAMWNTGYQANLAIEALDLSASADWRGALMDALGIGHDPNSVAGATFHGMLYFAPIYLVTLLAGGVWEIVFAGIRNHEINEGFFVTSILYALTLPATTPLWQVALGISFGVVMAKEVFGGTGKNFMNPALAGRAFLYFAYPVEMSGEAVWTPPIDVVTGATPLAIGAERGVAGITEHGVTWMDAFLGPIQGSIGETSALACLIGGALIVYTGVASWRIIAGVMVCPRVPHRWRPHRLHRRCLVADHRWSYARPGYYDRALQCDWLRHQSDVCDALVLAPGARRLCLWDDLHGHRSGHRVRHESRPVDLRLPGGPNHRCHPRGQHRVSRGDHACDSLRQHLCAYHRPLCHAGQYLEEVEAQCLTQ